MRIVLFSIFGFNVYSHGVFMVLGMVIGGWLLYRLAKKEGLLVQHFLIDYTTSLIIGILFSRICFYLLNLQSYNSLWEITQIWEGGLISFAGFILGTLTFLFLLLKRKQRISPWLNLSGIIFPLAIAIGRIGCALNGEFGIKTKSILAIYGYMPVTILEIYLGIVIFIFNFYLYQRYKDKLLPNILFLNFITLYSLGRVIIDNWRIDTKLIIGINLSQLVSLIIFIISLITYLLYLYEYQRKMRQHDIR